MYGDSLLQISTFLEWKRIRGFLGILTLGFNGRVTVKHLKQSDFFFPLPIQVVPAVFGIRFRVEVGATVVLSYMIRLDKI